VPFCVACTAVATAVVLAPILQVLTTTGRFNMLREDMDFNAGAYQDGVPMDVLTRQLFDLTIACSSGQRTAGELAKHSQVTRASVCLCGCAGGVRLCGGCGACVIVRLGESRTVCECACICFFSRPCRFVCGRLRA
jgi:hypothetical protein